MTSLRRLSAVLALVLFISSCASSTDEEPRADAETEAPNESPSPSPSPTIDYVEAEIGVGANPGSVVAGFGSIWVGDHVGATVTRIDPDSNEVEKTIKVAGEPSGVAVGYGSVWTYGSIAAVVNRIDPDTNKVTKIKIDTQGGGYVGGVALDGAMWFPGEEGNVFRVDPDANEVVAKIPVGRGPCNGNIAGGAGSIWWACEGAAARIDPATNSVADTFKLGGGANTPTFGNGAVWFSLQQEASVARVDPETGMVTDTFKVGDGVEQLRVTPTDIWVRVDDDELARVDPRSLKVTDRYELPGAQIPGGGIAVGFGSVWAVNFSSHTVSRIDPKT